MKNFHRHVLAISFIALSVASSPSVQAQYRAKTFRWVAETRRWEELSRESVVPKPSRPEPALVAFRFNNLASVVRVGKVAWDVITNNRSVYSLERDRVSVLPEKITTPIQLSGWRPHQTESYKVLIEDFAGLDMLNFRYHLNFDHHGTLNSKGQYLANVHMIAEDLKISALAMKFNVRVESEDPTNVGSREKPVASMKVNVILSVQGPIATALKTDEFTFLGDGSYRAIQRSQSEW